MSDAIDMTSKVDNYVQNPGYYSQDLTHQYRVWQQNLILPYGSSYTHAVTRMEATIKKAKEQHKKDEEEARRRMEIGLAICLFALDVFVAGALLRKVAGAVARVQSAKSITFFLNDTSSAGAAAVQFLSQQKSFSDLVVGDLATKAVGVIKDKVVYERFKQAALAAGSAMGTADIPEAGTVDPLIYQNNLERNYKSSVNKVNKLFVDHVRDGKLDERTRRSMVSLMTTLPITRPPRHAFPSEAMSHYIEVLCWVDYCFRLLRAAPKPGDSHVPLVDLPHQLASKVNDKFAQVTGCHVGEGGKIMKGTPRNFAWSGHIMPVMRTQMVGQLNEIAGIASSALANIVKQLA